VSEPLAGAGPDPAAALREGPLHRWLAPTSESRIERIACGDIDPRPWSGPPAPDDQLLALTRSVRHRGIVEPLLLRPVGARRFELVLGSRRIEAAHRLGMTHVPAIVRELDGAEAALLAAWTILPRMQGRGMVEVATRLSAAGVSEPEIAVILGAAVPGVPDAGGPGTALLDDAAPLRFAGAATPVSLVLDALGHGRLAALRALRRARTGLLA
jgi:hypothetical protein